MSTEKAVYVDISRSDALYNFGSNFYGLLASKIKSFNEIVILCIGTDKATGDCLGPITGYKLTGERGIKNSGVKVYGTLEKPVHAKNIHETIDKIHSSCENPLIIAIDACLGKIEHVGFLTIGDGAVKPGAGVNKKLPSVGHISITGIVNFYSAMDFAVLQNTRLNMVMKMADIINGGIAYALFKTERLVENERFFQEK